MNLQSDYDLRVASRAAGDQIKREITPLPKPKPSKSSRPPKASRSQPRAAALAASSADRTIAGKLKRKP